MADDRTNRFGSDRKHINVNEDYELRYWSKKFGVDADQLRQAVKQVGTSAEAVSAFFKK